MTNKKQFALLLLCWVLYITSYVAKYSYTANINPIMSFYSVNKTDAGLISTLFFFSYGTGQIVNGLLCKFYNKKYVISGATIISAVINGIIFFQPPFAYLKYLWLINGIAQSVLWSSLMLVLGENLEDAMLSKAVFMMGISVPVGTLVAYGAGALFLSFGSSFYKYSFLLGALSIGLLGIIWFCFYSSLTVNNKRETVQPIKNDETDKTSKSSAPLGFSFLFLFASLCLFAILVNFVKDGVSTWFPTILKESFNFNDSLSALLTFVLPVFGIFGTTVSMWLNKRIKDYIAIIGVVFLATAVIIGAVLFLFTQANAVSLVSALVVICFGLISCIIYSANNIITSRAPLFLRNKMNAGLTAGLLNGFCYLGSTLAAYLIGLVADASGWISVFVLLLSVCVFVLVYTAIYLLINLFRQKNSKT